MARRFNDSLRGYSFEIHKRDDFVCVYCGLDGKVWPNWLYLSRDHLLPTGNCKRDNPEYMVTACVFCNELHNKTRFDVEDSDGQLKTRHELVEQKKVLVLERTSQYEQFWRKNVNAQNDEETSSSADKVSDEEIVDVCMPILEDAQREWGTFFLNAYQLWGMLNQSDIAFCERMREQYGTEVGEGAGERFTPVGRISQALSHSKKIQRHYMDGRLSKFRIGDKDIVPANIYNIYRVRRTSESVRGDENR